jgi:hypothetical protein
MERKGINEYSLDGEVLWVNGNVFNLLMNNWPDLLKDYILNL